MLDALSPQRRRFVLGLIALGVALVLIVVVATVVSAISARVTPVAQDDQGPVLLVPGYGGSGASLAPLASALRHAGRDVVIVRRGTSGPWSTRC
jgi:triacylglycerol lipase